MPIYILGHSLLQVVLDDRLLALAKEDGTSLGLVQMFFSDMTCMMALLKTHHFRSSMRSIH